MILGFLLCYYTIKQRDGVKHGCIAKLQSLYVIDSIKITACALASSIKTFVEELMKVKIISLQTLGQEESVIAKTINMSDNYYGLLREVP